MKIPLRYGIPLLLALWLGSGLASEPPLPNLLRMLAIGVALWTAFSLPIPRRYEEEEDPEGYPITEDADAEEDSPENGGSGTDAQRRHRSSENNQGGGKGA